MKRDFPEVEQTLRLFQMRTKQLFENEDKSFLEEKGYFAEPSVFELFHLPLYQGNRETALQEINSIVLTQPLAEKYFGLEDPVGKVISINNSDRKVTGVLEPLPRHFHLDFKFLVSFENLLADVSEERINSWVWQDFLNYVKFFPDTDVTWFDEKLPAFVEKYAHPQTKEYGFYYYLNVQNVADIYLHSAHLRNDPVIKGDYQYVLGLSFVGIFLLFIACVNFINLTTAHAMRRSKEVGVRKAAGARRSQLAIQFISEAVLVLVLSQDEFWN